MKWQAEILAHYSTLKQKAIYFSETSYCHRNYKVLKHIRIIPILHVGSKII
jgi:hypothetical protein